MSEELKVCAAYFSVANDPKAFYQQVLQAVTDPQPFLVHEHWYRLKDLLIGHDLWEVTDKGVHIRAGRSFAWMVGKELVPYKAVTRDKGQTGPCDYHYIGNQTFKGGDQ